MSNMPGLKIEREHYDILAQAIRVEYTNNAANYKAALEGVATSADIARFNWDMFRRAKVAGDTTKWVCDVLYKYLNDDHIDSALRRAVRSVLN